MDYHTADLNSWPARLVIKVGHKIRSARASKVYSNEAVLRQREKDAAKQRQRQGERSQQATNASLRSDVNELGEREYSIFSETSTLVEQAVLTKDHTDMMHRLAHHDSFDSLVDNPYLLRKDQKSSLEDKAVAVITISIKDEDRIASLSDKLWQHIASYLSVADAASLALATKALSLKLGTAPLEALKLPDNKHDKITFLHRLDGSLPDHLLCFPCTKFHLRIQPGKEVLKADFVSNPLFTCPLARHTLLPRMRLVHRRELPYSFIQLALRSHRHTPSHGLSISDLSRRWTCRASNWTHATRYLIHSNNHLLLRVISSIHAPPASTLTATAERHLLYEREDYLPFFSVCAHWRDGDLMRICKCALSHVPAPPDPYLKQLRRAPKLSRSAARPNFLVTGCDECRPARRCPECPTEYLVEIQMIEDKNDAERPFKHALVVTRWSDLGDGSSPFTSPEWAAVNGIALPDDRSAVGGNSKGYESFSQVGRRAVAGIFESRVSGSIPGQRMISLNPKNEKLGEDGHGWY